MGTWSSLSLAHPHFGEDPMTHLVDPAVIKDTIQLQNLKLPEWMLLNPGDKTSFHPHTTFTLLKKKKILQLLHYTNLSNTHVSHQPLSVHPHAQLYELLAKKHFFIWPKRVGSFCPPLLASFVTLTSSSYSKFGQLAYMHSTPAFPKVIGLPWCLLFVFFIVCLIERSKDDAARSSNLCWDLYEFETL